MNALVKKIAAKNFKVNAELEEQYIFDDGYCFFVESQAKKRKASLKKKYHTINRDTKMEQNEQANGEKIAALELELNETKELLLDATDEQEKADLIADVERIEEEIEALR